MIRADALRTVLAGAAFAGLLAIGGPAGSAQAASARPTDVPGASRGEVRAGTAAAHRVVTFAEEYSRAVLHQSGETPRAVRERFLAPHLNVRLDAWASEHGADPVFRAQNVPSEWSVQQVGEEHGFASIRFTEYWGGGSGQEVWYTVRLGDLRIVELNDAPAF
ncbi:hypothetical protein ACFWA9_27855 [Kitasatospora sp. NPDC059973]|uniref:hypothetical protein n=1 Tax=Kitasatospora sp. NPDC059973 TaxID=3347020 RepID=UPI0036C39896